MPHAPWHRPDSLAARLFPTRQVVIRASTGCRTLTIGSGSCVAALLAVYLSVAGLAFAATGYLATTADAVEPTNAIVVPAEAGPSRPLAEARLRQIVADLRLTTLRQQETIETLGELRTTLEQELAASREELAAAAEERDRARQAVTALAAASGAGAAGSEAAGPELAEKVRTLEAQLAVTAGERDDLRRIEKGLRWRVDMLETRMGELRRSVSAEAGRVREWIVKQVSALEGVLATSGVDVDRLIERVDTRLSAGLGGPLVPLPAAGRGADGGGMERIASQPGLKQEMAKLRAMHALLQTMPLVPPMETYRKTSGFGPRRDPINGRPAMHAGLDFGGPPNAEALATAPGRVVTAGRVGAYGNMVEIDHGMGIRTRYGHLKRVLVKVGDKVALRQPVGVMGSTGRSTGEHLHYEVRVDGEPLDPAAFLDAGGSLKHVFKG